MKKFFSMILVLCLLVSMLSVSLAENAAKELGLPDNEEVLMLLDLGYAAEDSKPLPNHFQRKPITETVKYI